MEFTDIPCNKELVSYYVHMLGNFIHGLFYKLFPEGIPKTSIDSMSRSSSGVFCVLWYRNGLVFSPWFPLPLYHSFWIVGE